MKIIIEAEPKELVEILKQIENRKNNAATAERIYSMFINKLDQATHAASDFSRGMESYSVGLDTQCVGQPTTAGGDGYGK